MKDTILKVFCMFEFVEFTSRQNDRNFHKVSRKMKPHERILQKIDETGDEQLAIFLQRFFKTGKGQYAEGDIFKGIKIPVLRKLIVEFRETELDVVAHLLQHPWHDARLAALFIMIHQFKKGNSSQSEEIYEMYMRHKAHVNNWDLVDLSAPNIVGTWLLDRDRSVLYDLVRSDELWDRRIAIVSTLTFIRNNDFGDTLKLSELLLGDKEDLMHKASGWMLREMGKKDVDQLRGFLVAFADQMPRTMLRYSIEKFPEDERKSWLAVKKRS